jgi:signal transduction histidine kinase/predicted ATPase
MTPFISEGKLSIDEAWILSNKLLDWLEEQHNKGLQALVFYPKLLGWDTIQNHITITDVKINEADSIIPPQYLAPEETGRIFSLPDYRSDYYRLGIIWYELFTGQPPFSGKDPVHIIWQHLAQNPPNPKSLNSELADSTTDVISKLLSKNQTERYQTSESLRYDWHQAHTLQARGELDYKLKLGTTDFPKQFVFPDILIGRISEMEKALSCVKVLSQQPIREILWIEGVEGSGKSFFLKQLENRIKLENPIVIHSTFREDDTLPYNSIKTVFEQLCLLLISKPLEIREKLTLQIKSVLGTNDNVLTDFVPLWEEILGKNQPAPVLGAQETQNRLSYVLTGVLAVFSNPGQSLNLILEDIHLATPQTLRLLEILLNESQLRHFLLIVSVRSDIPLYYELNKWLDNAIIGKGTELSRIQLDTLPVKAVTSFFSDALVDPDVCQELAETVVRKTGGVPIFIRQLMESASASGCISPDVVRKHWRMDQSRFAKLDITENMVEYLNNSMLLLPPDAKRFLQAASIIGLSFNIEIIAAALTSNNLREIATIARRLHKLEIIVPDLNEGAYRFSNSQLLRFAFDTSLESDKQEFRLLIAEYLYNQGNYKNSDVELYRLLGIVTLISQSLPAHFVPLLESGALKAEASGAFEAAYRYYVTLLGVDEDTGSKQKRFNWQLKKLSMLVFALRFNEYNVQREIMLSSTKDILQIAELDLIECRALILQQDINGAVSYTIYSLKKIGVFLKENPSVLRIVYFLIRTKMIMRGKSNEYIENLPLANDRRTQLIVDILQSTSSAFFLAAPKLLTEINAWQIQSTFKMGLSSSIGQVFASYGFILSSISHNFSGAEEMMRLAQKLDTRLGNASGRVVSRFIHLSLTRHWHYPISENAVLLEENYALSRNVGAIQIAFYSLATSDIFKIFSGLSLTQTKIKAEENLLACSDKQQIMMVTFLRMVLQLCDDLSNEQQPENLMEGVHFSTNKELDYFIKNNFQTNLSILSGFDGLIGIVFQRYQGANKKLPHLLEQLSPVGLSSVSMLHAVIFQTIRAYKSNCNIDKYMRKARSHIRSWAVNSPYNFAVWHNLLEAIINRSSGMHKEALYHLEQALLYSKKHGVLYAEAILWEEKTGLIAEIQPDADIVPYVLNAYQIYHKWGAFARCTQLQAIYPQLHELNKSDKSSGHNIDLLSLMRASNSIAGEIRWENLLEKLTTILIENAGAQTAQLLLPGPGGLKLVARKTGETTVTYMQTQVMEETHPVSLLRTVWRNKTPEVLSNAAQDMRWVNDVYIQQKKPLSVLCMPIVKNQELTGIIYLENNLTSGAFTHERLDLVHLLSGQIAVSLENAQLYDDLENRVVERTRQLQEKNLEVENQKKKAENALVELQTAQNQLIHVEKMASLGELTAGVAHEIQNPLNFVNNFSELSVDLARELKEEIENLKILEKDKEYVNELIEDLCHNQEKINQHGKRASDIVKGMLEHSRKSTGEKELTDINSLCDEYLRLSYHGLRVKDKTFNANFETHFDPYLPRIDVIPQDFCRVILNLINNAFWAVNDKRQHTNDITYLPLVSVTTKIKERDNKVLIEIKDNGSGIADQIKDRIFQPFFTTKPTGQGTGLGLSLSYDIVTKGHGGTLEVESTEGTGSKFIISLPYKSKG